MRAKVSHRTILVLLISIYTALVPYETALSIGTLGSVNRYIGLFVIGFILITGMHLNKDVSKPLVIRIIVFVGYCALTVLWSKDRADSFRSLSMLLNLSLFTLILFFGRIPSSRVNVIMYSMVATAVISSVLISSRVSGATMTEVGRTTIRIGSSVIDYNNMAVSIAIPFLYVADQLFEKKYSLKLRMITLSAMVLMIYAIFLTGSRGGLLAALFGFVCIFAIRFQTSNRKKLSMLVGVFVVLYTAYIVIDNYVPLSLLERFSVAGLQMDGGAGRADLWSALLNYYAKGALWYQIFGFGYGSSFGILKNTIGRYAAAHNDLIQILVETGIVGLGMYLSLFIKLLTSSWKKKDAFAFAITMCLLMASLTLEMTIRKLFWMSIFIAALSMNVNASREVQYRSYDLFLKD